MKARLALPLVVLAALGGLLAARRRRNRHQPRRPGPPPAGVREPRRPLQPTGSGAAFADPPAP